MKEAPKKEEDYTSPDYQKTINDEEALKLFLNQIAKFDQHFCDGMVGGDDFTVRIEVHGNNHKILHVRTYNEAIKRPGANNKKK